MRLYRFRNSIGEVRLDSYSDRTGEILIYTLTIQEFKGINSVGYAFPKSSYRETKNRYFAAVEKLKAKEEVAAACNDLDDYYFMTK